MSKTQQEIAAPDTSEKAVAEQHKKQKTHYFTSRKITQYAVFVALALVMKLVGKSLTLSPTFTVTFIYIPWILSGAVLGPIGGMVVGALSDVLGNFMFGAQFIPLTFVSNLLYPLPTAIIYAVWKRGNNYVKLSLGAICSLLLCTLGIGSLAIYTFYGYYQTMNFFMYLLAFRMPQVGVFFVNLVVLILIIAPLVNVGVLPETKKSDSELLKTAMLTVGMSALTALTVAALIIIGATKPSLIDSGMTEGMVGGTMGIVIIAYGVLMCLVGLTMTKKDSTVSAVLKAVTVVLLYAALTVSAITYQNSINILYMFLIAVALFAVIAAIRLVGRKKGVKSK